MNDLGFGLLDRRTVIVTLLTIVIANVLFQFNLPIRTSSAGELFVDLVIFTGYLYLVRSLLRLPFALLFSLFAIPDEIHKFTWSQRIIEMVEKKNSGKLKIFAYKTAYMFVYFVKTIVSPIIVIPFFINDFEAFIIRLEIKVYSNETVNRMASFIRFFDRAGLIALIVLSTLPNYTATIKTIGAFGLAIMLLIYIFKGEFTLLIKDKIKEQESGA